MDSPDMTKMGEIYWSGEEGFIRLGNSFYEEHRIVQLDLLQDTIWQLQKKYESMVIRVQSEDLEQ
tara:strand:+ start:56 stop:250 length:195 start_codon:yes stop_codon:yes gene_type:complete